MPDEYSSMTKETFVAWAGAVGLDVKDEAHMDELYSYYTQNVVPGLKALDELDLTDVEPAMIYSPPKE